MKNIAASIFVLVAAFVAEPVVAGTLTTPALSTGNGDNVNCRVLNTGSKSAEDITIEIRNQSAFATESRFYGTIASGKTNSAVDVIPSSITYCRVDGKKISKNKTRVTHCVRDAANTPIVCVTAP